MKTIRLNKLVFQQFKAFENYEITFGPRITNVYGANGTRKTSIKDGFNFLLFDKNSEGNTRFSKKPLDKDGNTTNKVNNVVFGELEIDGRITTLEHVHQEKWTTNGEGEEEFGGNENVYKYNDVPTKPVAYKKMIDDILTEESFKMVTNPEYFASLEPAVKKQYVEKICGTMSDLEVAQTHNKFNELIADINLITLTGLKTKLVAQRTKIKSEISDLPKLIQEAIRDLPEDGDVDVINANILKLEKEYQALEEALLDINAAENLKNDEEKKLLNEIHQLELSNQKIFNTHKSAYELELHDSRKDYDSLVKKRADISQKVLKLEEEIEKANKTPDRIEFLNSQLVNSENDIKKLGVEFDEKNAEEFDIDETSLICKHCGELPSDPNKVEEKRAKLRIAFYTDKNAALDAIEEKGTSLSKIIANLKSEISTAEEKHKAYKLELSTSLTDLQSQKLDIETKLVDMDDPSSLSLSIPTTEQRVSSDLKYLENSEKVKTLRAKQNIEPKAKPKEFTEIMTKKAIINGNIDSLKRKKMTLEQRSKKLERKDELTDNGKKWGALVAELDRQISLIGNFERTKAKLIEDQVAKHFKYVRFKFFDFTQEGEVKSTCEILWDGVPYPDLNSAKKLNAGLDIINTLSTHFGVSAPIFIDNRESITEIIETNAQVINLIVSPQDKELRVESI